MIESLVAIVVLSFGMLGVVGLQAAALQSNKEARYQSSAVRLARELGELLRGNKDVAIAASSADNPYLVEFTGSLPSTSADCFAGACATTQDVASFQIVEWLTRVDAELPGARVSVCIDDASFDAGGLPVWDCSGTGGTVVVKPHRGHLAIGHADIGWIKNPVQGTEFDLGFAVGPRGFPIHAFTGDRTYFTTAEYRVILADEVLKTLAIGVAGFVDHGGAWFEGSKRRTGTNLGMGIRLGPSRVADANQTRLDLAYRFKNDQEKAGWVFVIASGLTFNTQPRGL